MRIAGVHIERNILVTRDLKSGYVSSYNFKTIEELFNSKEIKKCERIFINAGENNFLIKVKFFPEKNPEEATNYVAKHLDEIVVGTSKEYLIKLTASSKENGSNVYIIEGKEKQIQKRIIKLPVEDYKISGVIPENFAISYPFMLDKDLDKTILIIEVGEEDFILTYLEKKTITFTRSSFFEKKELLDSLKKEIDILLHRAGSVDKIYFTGRLTDKELKKIKKDFPSYKRKINKFLVPMELTGEAMLAYGLSLTPNMEFDTDLTPGNIVIKREKYKEEIKIKKLVRRTTYAMGIVLSLPLIFLIAGQIWLSTFNRRINQLRSSFEKNTRIQAEVRKLREKLKLHEEIRTPIPWATFLFEVSNRIPDNVCLKELDSEPTMNQNNKGFIFNLTGEGKSQEAVMDFYSKIQAMDIVEETNIKSIKNEKGITSFIFTVVVYSE